MRIMLALLLGLALPAHAADQSKSDWYKSLRVPGSRSSCCDVADCAPAMAVYRDGSWWVLAAGETLRVRPEVILQDVEPYDGVSAYACIVGGSVRCFIRPGSGG